MIVSCLSSKDRMLAALECREVDYVPCCFSAFQILQQQCANQEDFLDRQLEMGLDVIVRLPTMPIRHDPGVHIREWREELSDEPYPILHKEYETLASTLSTTVSASEDWPWGDHIPFMDDFLIPRSRKFLITPEDNLDALRYLLPMPTDRDMAKFSKDIRSAKALAAARGLLMVYQYGMVGDVASWLCGIQEFMMLMVHNPDFAQQFLNIIDGWNSQCMELVLKEGVDLYIRRAWYENADFFPPSDYARFILPGLRRDVEMAHQAGVKFGYLMSCASMPLMDMIIGAGVDVLMGIDPAQDRTMDMALLKQKASDKMCLWGGVCGYLTMECGTPDQIREQVRQSISILSPGGGFILAPVTNIRADNEQVWDNVKAMIGAWKVMRKGVL